MGAEGILPLEVMIANMRHFYYMAQAAEHDGDRQKALMSAQECAKDAAPYTHPRLASTELTGKDRQPLIPVINLIGRPEPED